MRQSTSDPPREPGDHSRHNQQCNGYRTDRQQVSPGCGFSNKAASGRIGAGVLGALAIQGKWCRGSGTGPAFPLKAKVLVRILQDPSLYQGPSALAHCDVSGEDWGLLTPSVPTSRVPPPTDWKVPPTPHFSVWQSHTLTREQTDNQAHYNDCGGVVRAVP